MSRARSWGSRSSWPPRLPESPSFPPTTFSPATQMSGGAFLRLYWKTSYYPYQNPNTPKDRMDLIAEASKKLAQMHIKFEALFATPRPDADGNTIILFRAKVCGKTMRFAAPLINGRLGDITEVTTSERKRINKKQNNYTPVRRPRPKRPKKNALDSL